MKKKASMLMVLTFTLVNLDGSVLLAQKEPSGDIAKIAKIEGTPSDGKVPVEVRRKGKNQNVPVKVDEVLYYGDMLLVNKGATVVIKCTHNNSKEPILRGRGNLVGVGSQCPQQSQL